MFEQSAKKRGRLQYPLTHRRVGKGRAGLGPGYMRILFFKRRPFHLPEDLLEGGGQLSAEALAQA